MEKVVRVFKSFKEADEANRRERMAMTPEQRMEAFLSIQQRTYPNGVNERLARVYRVLKREQS